MLQRFTDPTLRDRRAKRPPLDPICAECGLDIAALERRRDALVLACQWAAVSLASRGVRPPEGWMRGASRTPARQALEAMGFKRTKGPLGESDHVVPLWRGGRESPENRQSLCQPCHAEKTKDEAGQRARERKLWGRG